MKTFKLLSLVAIALIALAPLGWAAGHGGGGGGFHGGGGGFHGGGGFGGGHFGGGGFRAGGGHFGGGVGLGGARFSGGVPHVGGGGSRVSSFGTRPAYRQPVYNGAANRSITSSVPRTAVSNGRQNQTASSRNRVGQVPRSPNQSVNSSGRAPRASNRQQNQVGSSGGRTAQGSRSAAARPANQGALSARNHTFARHDGNWHRDWDRRHAHFDHGHFFVFDGGYWIGLDAGYYPWDYYPYYAYDYYPYDYYAGSDPGASNYVAQNADPNVTAVQSELAKLGYYSGPVDGRLGPATRSALTRYQIDHHLGVTGSLSTETLQSLSGA